MLKEAIRSRTMFLKGEHGFSLTELVVVMSIFLTVMLITAKTFNTIVNQSSQLSKSIETNIEGVVGLEVLRADLEQAGFGLPWSFQSNPNYAESNLGANMPAAAYWPSGDADSNFNDAPNNPPLAVLSANTNFNIDGSGVGANYLVIKSTSAATNNTARKWANLSYANGVKTLTTWGDSGRDFDSTDRVTVVKNKFNSTPPTRQLVVNAGTFSATFSSYSGLFQPPPADGDTFQIYGVGTTTLRMPFNRADYYIMPPVSMPQGCAPNTGILYKANISHASGGYAPFGGIPLVDCVADMQVSYGLDTDNGGRVNFRTNTPPTTAELQRDQLREIRVDILAQDGKMDRFYTYPSTTVDVGDFAITGRRFDLSTLIGTGWQNYRWKVYTIVVRPMNMIQ